MAIRDSYLQTNEQGGVFRVQREAFLDPDVLAAERERIFDRSWLYLGHESEVAEPGDFRARELARRRIVFVRGKDRVVRALINACTHRGAEVWGLHAIAALSPAPLAESGRPWVTWLRGEPRIERGVVRPTDAPGFGVELDPAAFP